MSDLYNRIEELCIKHNESITSMCKESGASRASLSDLKVGRKQSLSAETLSKIAAHFGVSVDYLLGMEESDWSFAFRQNMLEAMSNYDSFDYAEAGVDKNWLYAVANGDIPLTFKTACDVADVLGESFDSLLGRDYVNQADESEKPLVNGDQELTEYLEMLKTRPECRMLFQLTKNATKDDVEAAVRIIEALRNK